MYTDPKRLKATDPGTVENNPMWIFHETFNPDKQWVAETQELYRQGKIGDVACKRKLIEVLNTLIEPIRTRRKHYEERPADVVDALRIGTEKANVIAEETLAMAKKAMKQDYFRGACGSNEQAAGLSSFCKCKGWVLDSRQRLNRRGGLIQEWLKLAQL